MGLPVVKGGIPLAALNMSAISNPGDAHLRDYDLARLSTAHTIQCVALASR